MDKSLSTSGLNTNEVQLMLVLQARSAEKMGRYGDVLDNLFRVCTCSQRKVHRSTTRSPVLYFRLFGPFSMSNLTLTNVLFLKLSFIFEGESPLIFFSWSNFAHNSLVKKETWWQWRLKAISSQNVTILMFCPPIWQEFRQMSAKKIHWKKEFWKRWYSASDRKLTPCATTWSLW